MTLNYHSSAPEIYGFYSNMSLVCAQKLAKVCYLRNILENGCRDQESANLIKNGVCRSKTKTKVSEKKSGVIRINSLM